MIENIVDKGKVVSMFLVVLLLLTSLSSTAYLQILLKYFFDEDIYFTNK